MKNSASQRLYKKIASSMIVLIVAGFGTALLMHSRASTAAISLDAATGAPTAPAAKVTDTTANSGSAVKFQAAASHATPCGWTKTAPKYTHVVWIWEENKDASSVVGASPYFDALSQQCASLSNVQDTATTTTLPSEPQYAAGTSGSNCDTGITSNTSGASTGCISNDNDANQLTTESIFQQVKAAGGTWKSYQEGMPSNCDQSSGGTKYAFKHNPAAFYTQIRSDCNTLDVPIAALTCPTASNQTCGTPSNQLVTDINAGSLPTFTFITPNLNNDMHDGSVDEGDNWLHTYLPLIFNGPNYKAGNTAVFIMWDEGSANSGSSRIIPTSVVAPSISAGTNDTTAVNNIGLLRTTEEMLGLSPYLGCASGTPPGNTGTCNPDSNVSVKSGLNL